MAPLQTLTEVALSTLLFVLAWGGLRLWVANHGRIPGSDKVLHAHSWVQVAVSLALFTTTLLSAVQHDGLPTALAQTLHAQDAFLPRYAVHLSRVFEYLDMLFFVAAGHAPDLHFAFHHLTTPYLTWFRALRDFDGWRLFVGLNTFHHVLMHLFFAGVTSTRALLPWTRYVQLVAGVACDVWIAWGKARAGGRVAGYLVSAALLTSYFVLLTREIVMRRSTAASRTRVKTE
ncbi:uncharacterized protein PV09_00530 [Verruconis gallopava]|uniref:Elongation of fatty acids protein n=1 Tax=Verruconis gallopava TaxID=253628 RepID=A0A0D2AQ02_9PEZI|nr:uncharacterized protein PV09_00530 [Verruconis gallopava]KIW08565.1 hypothetical protein PV09_00530 [Verruconis gallopava]